MTVFSFFFALFLLLGLIDLLGFCLLYFYTSYVVGYWSRVLFDFKDFVSASI